MFTSQRRAQEEKSALGSREHRGFHQDCGRTVCLDRPYSFFSAYKFIHRYLKLHVYMCVSMCKYVYMSACFDKVLSEKSNSPDLGVTGSGELPDVDAGNPILGALRDQECIFNCGAISLISRSYLF